MFWPRRVPAIFDSTCVPGILYILCSGYVSFDLKIIVSNHRQHLTAAAADQTLRLIDNITIIYKPII